MMVKWLPPVQILSTKPLTLLIHVKAAIDPDSAADDFIQFITQPAFQTVIDLTQDGDEDPTVNVTDNIPPDSAPAHIENPIGSCDESLPGPADEPARKKTRKTNRPTSPVSPGPCDEPPRKTYRFTAVVRPEPNGELPRKAYRFTPAISPESPPERKTLCPVPTNSPATSPETDLFYDSSRSRKDDVTTWGMSQIDAWDQSSWTSERDEVSTTNAGQTPYPSPSPSSEEVEAEEVPPPQPLDESFDDLPPFHSPINSIQSFGQEFRDAQVDINNKYVELRNVQDDINNKLIALGNESRDRQIETLSRLDALHGELRAYHLETRSRFDAQDRFIQDLANEIFQRVNAMRSTIDRQFDRNDRTVTQYQRELMLILHHLILTIVDETAESN
ncbi:uncharacterized protein LOC113096500 isoform X1 [Carassius auratus]|uniref:Uncharacterized protein LOC113096500 isoform X1 n=1 Tax=Carassius auratus TaxID=7957 RepID=A0A6P6P9R6_CARAU|nr:uncharacterized protein LOC113096500 isoform X1 [Carassius auratus]